MSLCCSANRAEGLRLHGDMRRLAGAAVAAGGLMTSWTDGRLKSRFKDNQVFFEGDFKRLSFYSFSFSQDDFHEPAA